MIEFEKESEIELQSWRQTLIYSVEQDVSAEYEADKLILHSQNVKYLISEFENSDRGHIYAAYGSYQDIENFINKTYEDTEPLKFQDTLKNDSKGKIILVHNRQEFVLCLVLPVSFFLTKPIDEKSIQLTLFRILQDMTQTIIVCVNDQVITHWYQGENIPFSDQHFTKFSQFRLEQNVEEKIETKEISINNLIPKNFDDWSILPNANHSQQFLLYNQSKIKEQDKIRLKEGLRDTIIDIIHGLFLSNDGQVKKIMDKYLLQEFQTNIIVEKLLDFTTNWQNKIIQLDQEILQNILNALKNKKKNLNFNQMTQLQMALFNRLKTQLIKRDRYFYWDTSYYFPTYINQIEVTQIMYDFSEIKDKCRKKMNELIDSVEKEELSALVKVFSDQELTGQNIICQRCKFSTIRETNKENSIEKLSVVTTQQFILDSSQIQPTKNVLEKLWDGVIGKGQFDLEVKIIDFFNTNQESTDILIVKKDLKYSLLSIGSNGQSKLIRCLDSFTEPMFIYQRHQNILFGFNHRNIDAVKLQISDLWKISQEFIYPECQPRILIKVVYINYDQTFIGIDKNGGVYKWSGNHEKFGKIKCLAFDYGKSEPQMKDFKPSKYFSHEYKLLEACPSGKQFFLSNQYVIDIYNVNHQLMKSIDFDGKFTMFADSFDAFIVKQSQFYQRFQLQNSIVFPNLSNRQQIRQVNIEEEQESKIGNPFFDIMRGSQVKYGPAQPFLLDHRYKVVQLQIINSQEKKSGITDYLNFIQIYETCKFNFLDHKQTLEIIRKEEHEVNSILRFSYTRVPLQLCTIENNQLTPLIDGFRQAINCHLSLTVPQRAKLLKLGYIEDYLMNLKEKIYVVSIIGRQSSGKSYLLNRIFGTRFTVAASRCTDGIWASITQINNKQFLILDCEGLFSSQRTKNEETQLLSFLAAVCDVTILNQDLSFNRYLDELLDNLTNAIGRLTGDSLFKGTLLIVLRDISLKDSAGAKEQLLQNIGAKVRSRNSSFLNTLFNDSFNVYLFSNFEHQNFSREIDDLRKKFIQFAEKTNRWQSGKELMQTIKILLIQLETQDDENTDDLHFRFQLDEAVEKAKRNWVALETDLLLEFKEKQLQNNSYVLWLESEKQSDGSLCCEKIVKQIGSDLELNSQVSHHNSNLIVIQQFMNELIKQRKSYLFAQFEKEIKTMNVSDKENEIIKHQRTNVVRFFEEQERQYQFCSMQCSKCYLNCSKFQNHAISYQSLINTKDNQMQNLQKKYESESTTLELNETQTLSVHQQDMVLTEQINKSDEDIHYSQKFKQFIKLNIQLDNIQVSINNCHLVNDDNFNEMNFAKIVQKLKCTFQYLLHDHLNERILFPENESIVISNLSQFMAKEHQFLVNQRSLLQSLIFDSQSQQKKIQDKQSIIIRSKQKAKVDQTELEKRCGLWNESLIVCQYETKSTNDQIIKLNQEQANLEKILLTSKVIECSYLQSTNLIKNLRTVERSIQETQLEIDRHQRNLYDVKQKLLNSHQKFQEELDQQLNQISTLIEDQYKQLITNSIRYQEIDQYLDDLQHDYKTINNRLKSRKQLNQKDECEWVSKQLKKIDVKKYKSYSETVKDIETQQKTFESEKKRLEDMNIVQINCILTENNLGENDLEKFIALYQIAKKQELESYQFQETQDLDDQIRHLQGELKKLNFQNEDLKQKQYYFTLTLQLQQKQNEIYDLERKSKQFSDQIQQSKKKMNELTSQIVLEDDNLLQIESESSTLTTRINQARETLIIIDENIKTISDTIAQMESFNDLVTKYQNLENSKINLANELMEWEYFDSLKGSTQTEQNVIDMISEKVEANQELRKQHSQVKQQLETLAFEKKELLLIQELQKELDQLKSQEKQEHSCLRESHICDEECIICKDTRCNKKAGHQQEHLCEKLQHYCNEICSIASCESFCKKQFMHDGQHYCGNMHYCKIPCQYCGGDCQREQFEDHDEHICQLKGCIQKCVLCARSCNQEHQHSRQEGDVHFCENIHSCTNQCNQPGVCVWEYQEEKRVWKSEISSFDYTYFKLIDGGKQLCSLQSEVGKMSHGEIHSCKTEAHRCGSKCPECDGLCTKNYGHEGSHFAKQHRNKDSQVFTLEVGLGKKVEFGENLETFKYQVGESSCPETCADSCARRSRAHFHLIQCEGGDKCLGKTNKFCRHQKGSYQGFEHLQFDEVQCVEFWKLQKWEHPLCDGDKLATIQGCNFFCPFCPDTKKSFCKLPAWHSFSMKYEDHDFWCKSEHIAAKSSFKGLDIAFVIDSTGSMSSYISQAKQMVKNIMNKAKLSAGTNIRFGIVAYRDHPPQDSSFVTQVQQLGTEAQALAFLNSMTADGGGDYPEAVLDGLQAAVNLSWKGEYDKMLFLIGDAPPHGKAYSDQGQWPEGCPCKINENHLFKNMQRLSIQFKILELNSGLNKMISVFKSYIALEVLKEDSKVDFVTQVVTKVCQQIEMREITYRKD